MSATVAHPTQPAPTSGEAACHHPKRVAFKPAEVAGMVGMSESGIRNLIRGGQLRAVRWGERWLVPVSAIEELLGEPLSERALGAMCAACAAGLPRSIA
jgi:excisionase family DNA binding protein